MPYYSPYQPYSQPYQQPYRDPMSYSNQLAPSVQPVAQPTQQPLNQGLLWVQGEAGAKSYLVAPNTTVLLMDSEGSRFYLKSTDSAGMPNLRTFEYSEVLAQPAQASAQQINLDDKYVTRGEYDALKRQYEDLAVKISSAEEPKPSVKRGKAGNADE